MTDGDDSRLALGTVSDFQEFVWSLEDEKVARRRFYKDHPEMREPWMSDYHMRSRREAGLQGHQEVEEYRLKVSDWTRLPGSQREEWHVEFVDDHLDGGRVYEAPKLRFDGRPLRGRPDLVFRTGSGSHILIVERKFPSVPLARVPRDGWNNVQAQLWCYAWMHPWDQLPDANVLLVAEVWAPDGEHRTPIRSRADAGVHQLCLGWLGEYNEKYGGRIAPRAGGS